MVSSMRCGGWGLGGTCERVEGKEDTVLAGLGREAGGGTRVLVADAP